MILPYVGDGHDRPAYATEGRTNVWSLATIPYNSPLLEGWLRSRRGVLADWLIHTSEILLWSQKRDGHARPLQAGVVIKTLLLTLILFSLFACSSNKGIANLPSETKWQLAETHFNNGKYHKAAPYYEQLIFERSSLFTADAQFKLGECHFRRKKYVEAIFEYQELLRLFPEHRLAPDAQYQIGVAYSKISLSPHHDQTETEQAIEAFTIFSEKYPNDARNRDAIKIVNEMQMKLIRKTFQNGYIYWKMKDYPSAQLYLKEIIALGNRDDLEKRAAYYNALIHIDRREEADATQYVNHLGQYFADSSEHKSATTRLSRIHSKLWNFLYFY